MDIQHDVIIVLRMKLRWLQRLKKNVIGIGLPTDVSRSAWNHGGFRRWSLERHRYWIAHWRHPRCFL